MGYEKANGQYARTLDVTLAAVGTVATVTANGAAFELGDRDSLRLNLVVATVTGTTPSMTVKLQTSADGSTNWTDVPNGAFAAVTAAGTTRLVVAALDRFVRPVETLTGTTPSFTFSIVGEAV